MARRSLGGGGFESSPRSQFPAISGGAGAAAPGTASAVVDPLREVQRACERAADRTRHRVIFSRRQPPQLAGVDLNEIATTTLRLLERILPANIDIEFVPEADLPSVSADRSQMHQVLTNLCLSARDAMPHGGG